MAGDLGISRKKSKDMIRISKDKWIDRQRINYGYEERYLWIRLKIFKDIERSIERYTKDIIRIGRKISLDKQKDIHRYAERYKERYE